MTNEAIATRLVFCHQKLGYASENFSLLETESRTRKYVLSPAYDLPEDLQDTLSELIGTRCEILKKEQ